MFSITLVTVKRELEQSLRKNFLKSTKSLFFLSSMPLYWKAELHLLKNKSKNLCKLFSMLPPRDTPKQHSIFLYRLALSCPSSTTSTYMPKSWTLLPPQILMHQSLTRDSTSVSLSLPPLPLRSASWCPCWGSGSTSPHTMSVTFPLLHFHRHRCTLAGSLASEPCTSRFIYKSLPVGGGRALTTGTPFSGRIGPNMKNVFQLNHYILKEENQKKGTEF